MNENSDAMVAGLKEDHWIDEQNKKKLIRKRVHGYIFFSTVTGVVCCLDYTVYSRVLSVRPIKEWYCEKRKIIFIKKNLFVFSCVIILIQ